MTFFIMGIRFVSEIVALIIFGIWGFHHGEFVGAIGIPLVVSVIWAMLGSPKAPFKLQGVYSVILEVGIFLAASYALYNLGYRYLALTFFIITLGISILMRTMKI